jgi:hypothetical protein
MAGLRNRLGVGFLLTSDSECQINAVGNKVGSSDCETFALHEEHE